MVCGRGPPPLKNSSAMPRVLRWSSTPDSFVSVLSARSRIGSLRVRIQRGLSGLLQCPGCLCDPENGKLPPKEDLKSEALFVDEAIPESATRWLTLEAKSPPLLVMEHALEDPRGQLLGDLFRVSGIVDLSHALSFSDPKCPCPSYRRRPPPQPPAPRRRASRNSRALRGP